MRWMGTSAASVTGLLLVIFDERLEVVETHGPEFLPLAEPVFGFLERRSFQRADLLAAGLSPFDQARAFEHLHVLGSASEAHRERLPKLPAGFFPARHAGEAY